MSLGELMCWDDLSWSTAPAPHQWLLLLAASSYYIDFQRNELRAIPYRHHWITNIHILSYFLERMGTFSSFIQYL